MRLVIANDHGGRRLKKAVLDHLGEKGLTVNDLGVSDEVDRADYPDCATPVAQAVASGAYDLGILICGTGTGMAMAANRVRGARAANCFNEFLARKARAHNNANILTLGERSLGEELALAIVDAFLETPFEGGRDQERLNKF